jgi:hypothetical protein
MAIEHVENLVDTLQATISNEMSKEPTEVDD